MPSLLDEITTPSDLKTLSDQQLAQLADELRVDVIEAVSRTGGHLGSSLGVVELTVALHAVFNTPKDKLIWDVGHQCYPHKVLTGRRAGMGTLRQEGGLSGFTKRSESPYDPFGAAHSSTSISAAHGFTVARDLGQDTGDAIAVIGDGSISAGMAYEALNNAGAEGRRMFVILNDNEMSIAPPVGAMSKYMSGLAGTALAQLNAFGQDIETVLPGPMRDHARRARELVTGAVASQGTIFEELGFEYIGPIDGHDMSQLLTVLRSARTRAKGPVLIHCCTVKGKGYAPAETSADKYHGVAKFDVASGAQMKSGANAPSYTTVFGQTLTQLAEKDSKIVGITAAMPSGTGLDIFAQRFADRMFDVGIAEQHGVTFAAGLAASGLKPFCAIYSTFLQRGYDQIVHDVALQNLPVLFAVDRAGLVGPDGPTHAGSFDLSFMRCIPNMVIMAPADENECRQMLYTGFRHPGPAAVRYPRGRGSGVPVEAQMQAITIGESRTLRQGKELAILAFGSMVEPCRGVAERLDATLIDMRFVKPLDRSAILDAAARHPCLVTVEENAVAGGAGSGVNELLASERLQTPILNIGLADGFIQHGTRAECLHLAGLDPEGIQARIVRFQGGARRPAVHDSNYRQTGA